MFLQNSVKFYQTTLRHVSESITPRSTSTLYGLYNNVYSYSSTLKMETAGFCETLVLVTMRTSDPTLNQFQVEKKNERIGNSLQERIKVMLQFSVDSCF
jgi:hypothetical protein